MYEMKTDLSNVYIDRTNNGNKKSTIEKGKKKNKLTNIYKEKKERK